MITDAILKFFYAVINWLWGFLPSWDMTHDAQQVSNLTAYLTSMNGWFPVYAMLAGVTALGAVYAAMWGLKGVLLVIGWIRGSG